MGKAKRKPRPAIPDWLWYGRDGCWFCKTQNNYNQCKANRNFLKECGDKKVKGRTAGSKKSKVHIEI